MKEHDPKAGQTTDGFLAELHSLYGKMNYSLQTGLVTEGYASPVYSASVEGRDFNGPEIEDFIEEHKAELLARNSALATWWNPLDGRSWLGVAKTSTNPKPNFYPV